MPHAALLSRRAALAGLAVTLGAPALAQAGPGEPRFTLRAAPTLRRMLPEPAAETALLGFGEPGAVPVLRIRLGEELWCRLANATDLPLTLHWLGMRGANAFDGVGGLTQPPVAPGESFDYRFTPPDAGTFLVRSLVPGRAGEAGGRGLAAVLVVEEKEPPRVEAEHVVVLRDPRVEPTGALSAFGGREEAALAGRLGNKLLVGPAETPLRIVAAPGSRIRLRLANACNARMTRLRFDSLKVQVAAVDSQAAELFEPLRASLPFPPGTRYDLVVDLPPTAGPAGGVTALLGPGVPLVEILAEGAAVTRPTPLPSPQLPLNPLLPTEIKLQNALRRDLAVAGGATRGTTGEPVFPPPTGPVWTLAGAAGSAAGPPLFTAARGQPVVLAVTNNTGFPQPIHVHGQVVRILHGLDDGWEPYWTDTVLLPEGKVTRMAFVPDSRGRWAITSAVLERFDTGLWGWFEVA